VIVDALVWENSLYRFVVLNIPLAQRTPQTSLTLDISKSTSSVITEIRYRFAKIDGRVAKWAKILKPLDDVAKFRVYGGFSTHDANHPTILTEGFNSIAEEVRLHKVRLFVVPTESSTVAACVGTCVGDVDLDNLLVCW
jgi:hypothetical protein